MIFNMCLESAVHSIEYGHIDEKVQKSICKQ